VALTAAFVVGRTFFPLHWNWTVLTATIVSGGGPSRGEVVVKGTARLVGAGIGTVVATVLATSLPGHHTDAVVLIFVLLFFGSWWREIHYAAWAACVTCVMALLNTYLGTPGTTSLLSTRLMAIVIGAACATAACALIVPVTTTSMVRRRRALALQSLGDLMGGIAEGASDLPSRLHQFEARALELRRTRRPLRVQQAVVGGIWPVDPVLLATTASVLHCVHPARLVIAAAHTDGADNDLRSAAGVVGAHIGRTRQRLAGTAPEGTSPLTVVHDPRVRPLDEAVLAISASRRVASTTS
jgi:hypothetical protein